LGTSGHSTKTNKKKKARRPRLSALSPRSDQEESDLSWRAPPPADLQLSDVSSLFSSARPSPLAKTRVDHQSDAKAESHTDKMTVAQAERVVAEAQNLSKDLELVISNLRDRQEETEASPPIPNIHTSHSLTPNSTFTPS
jgi:hypothetical protein